MSLAAGQRLPRGGRERERRVPPLFGLSGPQRTAFGPARPAVWGAGQRGNQGRDARESPPGPRRSSKEAQKRRAQMEGPPAAFPHRRSALRRDPEALGPAGVCVCPPVGAKPGRDLVRSWKQQRLASSVQINLLQGRLERGVAALLGPWQGLLVVSSSLFTAPASGSSNAARPEILLPQGEILEQKGAWELGSTEPSLKPVGFDELRLIGKCRRDRLESPGSANGELTPAAFARRVWLFGNQEMPTLGSQSWALLFFAP